MGRTFAAMGTISSVLTPLAALVFGPVADLASPLIPIIMIAVIVIGAAFWVRAKVVIK
jgi:hypothetical protein